MPHDVTMPQLGMAQDAGKIVSWLKAPGDAVARGDALFEVETDKAVMEVESPADGYLTGVAASEGDDVPVGQVIARISDTADDTAAPAEPKPEAAPTPETPTSDALPEGHSVTMPQLGMAQDSGLLVTWLKSPGDEVAADDVLFEVETDKSTMEVEAGRKGWIAATLAQAGEEVPVGDPVAIISAEKPDATVARSVSEAGAAPMAAPPAPAAEDKPAEVAATPARPAPAAPKASGGRILASPKARRLALEQGLDLTRLVEAGHPQPFHVADLDVLRSMPSAQAAATPVDAPRRLTAHCTMDGMAGFAQWATGATGRVDADSILAGMAGASLGAAAEVTIGIERFGTLQSFSVPTGRSLCDIARTEDAPDLILRDLRGTCVSSVAMGAETAPVLTITTDGPGLSITLECAAAQLDAGAAIQVLTQFAGRLEHPLRHLL